jgi:AraC-like DNA-binding protein
MRRVFLRWTAHYAHYLTFVESELARGFDNSATSFQQDRLAATLLGSLKARLGAEPSAAQRRIDLHQIDRFIRRHLADELRVADLAKLACLSEAHFSERFRAQTGLSPWQYVRRQRLHAARQLILQSRLPLTDIAIQTGFANQSALSHAFRSSYGASPRQLRSRALPAPPSPRPMERRALPLLLPHARLGSTGTGRHSPMTARQR